MWPWGALSLHGLRRYIFPGLALGAHLGNTRIVTDLMIMAVAEALPRMLSDDERQRRAVYPDLANIRTISAYMAVAVSYTHLTLPTKA